MNAELQGTIYSPLTPTQGHLNCTLTLSHIPPRSWLGIFKEKFHLRLLLENQVCSNQYFYLVISYPAKKKEFFCGKTHPNVLYTGFSLKEVSVDFQFIADSSYNFELDSFQLGYRGKQTHLQ